MPTSGDGSSSAPGHGGEAQLFLDDMVVATEAIRADVPVPELEHAGNRIAWDSAALADGTTGSVVVGAYEGRCFVVHWQTPGDSGARGIVLDPALQCGATPELLATLPSPPFIETFPGTVPPLDASQIVKPAESRARPERVEPFPSERTPWWFVPALVVLLAVVLRQLVTLSMRGIRTARRTR